MVITPEQIRAARALLRMEQDELARRACVSLATIRRLEAADGLTRVGSETANGVRQVLEKAGATFTEGGVRRRQRSLEEIEARFRAMMEISKRSAARLAAHDIYIDDDLYDENGLPF